MITRRRLLIAAPLAAGLAACGHDDKSPSGAKAVTFLTGYGTTPRETYPYVGLGKHYFRDAGIDLKVLPGQPSDANLKALAAGQAQFAAVDFVSAVRGVKNYPDYRAILAVQSSTLLSIASLEETGIRTAADLAGRKIGAAPNAASQTLFPTYAKAAGLDPAKVTFVNAPSDQLPSLLATGRVDAIGNYVVDTPNIENAAQGRKTTSLPYRQYLGDLYGTVVIATTAVLADADLVKRFAGAMVESVRTAVGSPEEAGTLVQAELPTVKAALVTRTMQLMQPYAGEFSMDESRVGRGVAVLAKAGLATANLAPDAVVDFPFAATVG